ncbi:hypothetical protein GSI_08385 [Ganoderma sinense ZZ0214-1]|uniref:Uncharacterized protein n=1 Tax=Ganoderma sinense ZZ0214-1 TaxID=1077348 RepID=A0A2G8S6P0_9APHY|nr:hypothetical protein GSI_08385 [Ganoderma sinense ZZ0214-1]
MLIGPPYSVQAGLDAEHSAAALPRVPAFWFSFAPPRNYNNLATYRSLLQPRCPFLRLAMSETDNVVQSVEEFDNRVAETHSGATEVQDFARRTSYAFPSADVLVPAPMAVSILGQLTIVATATDFKLVEPKAGFQHVRYPDSFRATIMQLVNSGALALNKSFVNFDEINKRCAAVRPGVNNIVQLLVGHEDNTPAQNDRAIERHLPHQIESLSRTIEACLAKARETDQTFNDLLALVMEIHESCAATQGVFVQFVKLGLGNDCVTNFVALGENESQTREADLRKAYLEKEEEATQEMKRIGEEVLQKAREDFTNTQDKFNNAANSMPGGWELAGLGALDTLSNVANVLTFGLFKAGRHAPSHPVPSTSATPMVQSTPPVDLSDINDPGYQRASALREQAESLHILLTAGSDGRLDWNAIKSRQSGGCMDIKVRCDQVMESLRINNRNSGRATNTAHGLARRGKDLAKELGSVVPPGNPRAIEQLIRNVSAWREDVLTFACEADLKLGSSLLTSNAFLPDPNFESGGGKAELRVRSAQYRLAATQAQLNASRESSKAASDKLMEVNGQLGDIMAQLAKIDVQQHNWEEITEILRKAIQFLCELKTYLNNLVHFFDAVHNLVSVTLKEAADQFITIVKDASAIEDKPGGPEVKQIEGVTLDAWARQAIYNHALSAAKISKVVENISDMYVTLYDGNVHPGVNMLLGMGKLVGSDDREAVAAAGKEIQDWAQGASDKIVHLISERTHENEQDIQNRIHELENSLGTILPQSSSNSRIEEIVHDVEQMQVQETTKAIAAAADANPVYGNSAEMSSARRKKVSKKVFV